MPSERRTRFLQHFSAVFLGVPCITFIEMKKEVVEPIQVGGRDRLIIWHMRTKEIKELNQELLAMKPVFM